MKTIFWHRTKLFKRAILPGTIFFVLVIYYLSTLRHGSSDEPAAAGDAQHLVVSLCFKYILLLLLYSVTKLFMDSFL
jgi:hypothetical protein